MSDRFRRPTPGDDLAHISPPLHPFAVHVSSLGLDPANVRKHPERNVTDIAASLRRFGQQRPILCDANGTIRAGNGTFAAATTVLGWQWVAVIPSTLSGTDITAYAIADNRTGETSEWDMEALAAQLRALDAEGFELAATGWAEHETSQLLAADWTPPPQGDMPDRTDGGVGGGGGADGGAAAADSLTVTLVPADRADVERAIALARVRGGDATPDDGAALAMIARQWWGVATTGKAPPPPPA